VEMTYELARTRVRTNAARINRFELALYADLVDARAKRLRLLLDLYAEVQRSTHAQRDSEYCAWRRLVNPGETCRCTSAQIPSLTFDGCVLPPVAPQLLPRSVAYYLYHTNWFFHFVFLHRVRKNVPLYSYIMI